MKHIPVDAQSAGKQPGNTRTRSANPVTRGVTVALLVIAALSAFVTFGVAAWSVHKPTLVIEGEVQAMETKVAPKVIGRVQALHVCKGDNVRKGQLLVSLANQELQAKLEQAQAAMELAKEHNQIVRAACIEYICAQSNLCVKTTAAARHAEQTVDHLRALQAAKVVSVQELHEAERNLDWAQSSERAAKASFALVTAVFGNEGELVTTANLEQATHTLTETEALIAELALTSPIDGQVQDGIIRQGELATPGLPVASIVGPQDVWVRFNIPEDLLSSTWMGSTLRVRVPALANQEVLVKVNNISPKGVAPKRAGEGTYGFDLRTFEVRAVPVQVTGDLRSGMTALLTCRNFN